MTFNFKECSVASDIAGKNVEVVDIREAFANIIYQRMGGIAGLTLAQKIYKSEGETVFTTEEETMIKNCAENYCIPAILNALIPSFSE